MRKTIYFSIFLIITTVVLGCKKFLNVTPIDAQSGNNFWRTRADVEGFTNGIYGTLRSKIGGNASVGQMLLPSIDMRCNSLTVLSIDASGSVPINNLLSNNLRPIVSGSSTYDVLLKRNMDWKPWYDVIAAANILYQEVDRVPTANISDQEKLRYKGEAVFLRNLCYLYICQLFGDAVYYTEAFHNGNLTRTPQLEVMKKCIQDMSLAKDYLPVQSADASSLGVRPTRASAVALLMHLNMWASAWDNTNDKLNYYKNVTALQSELDTYSQYFLLDINPQNTKLIFRGRTAENLFSVIQDFNFSESFSTRANASYFYSHFPIVGNKSRTNSYLAYQKKYIEALFPLAQPDSRLTTWFENYNSATGTFQFKKYVNTYTTGFGDDMTNVSDDCATLLRLPDMYLLAAEAYAELGDDGQAKNYLNKVRTAAGATSIVTSGEALKDDIFRERCRELIGEGHFFFDVVRTKRYAEQEFVGKQIGAADFNAGAWTWPLIIGSAERLANPKLTVNTFWN